jgi:hypothetical protein
MQPLESSSAVALTGDRRIGRCFWVPVVNIQRVEVDSIRMLP